MKLTLERRESFNGYLFGKLSSENGFISDTLEMNCNYNLKPGKYLITVDHSPLTNQKTVYIRNLMYMPISKFIANNTTTSHGIAIRLENAFIELGFEHNKCRLIMFEKVNRVLIHDLEKDLVRNIVCELSILNAINDSLIIETVTN